MFALSDPCALACLHIARINHWFHYQRYLASTEFAWIYWYRSYVTHPLCGQLASTFFHAFRFQSLKFMLEARDILYSPEWNLSPMVNFFHTCNLRIYISIYLSFTLWKSIVWRLKRYTQLLNNCAGVERRGNAGLWKFRFSRGRGQRA